MTLTLILLIIPFVGAIVGLMGKSWDDSQNKMVKLTRRGWISLGIIILGFLFTGIKTVKIQIENDRLKEQKERVRKLAYEKIRDDCQSILRPITTIYLENSNGRQEADHHFPLLCKEMISEKGLQVFSSCNLLDSVKGGTAFEHWDRSYADYLYGYYNSNQAHNLEKTMTQWANYIDMEDLILIDSINNHLYWTVLQNINYGKTEPEKQKFIEQVGVFYFFDNDGETLKEQNEFIHLIYRLTMKAGEVHRTTMHKKS